MTVTLSKVTVELLSHHSRNRVQRMLTTSIISLVRNERSLTALLLKRRGALGRQPPGPARGWPAAPRPLAKRAPLSLSNASFPRCNLSIARALMAPCEARRPIHQAPSTRRDATTAVSDVRPSPQKQNHQKDALFHFAWLSFLSFILNISQFNIFCEVKYICLGFRTRSSRHAPSRFLDFQRGKHHETRG